MSDFTVNIDSHLDLSEAESRMATFLSKYQNEPIQIKVEPNFGNVNTSNLGKQLQSSVNNSVKSVKFNGKTFYKKYFEQAKKDIKEGQTVQKSFEKEISFIGNNDVDNIAMKAAKAKATAEKEYLENQQKQAEQLSRIRDKEYKLYDNPYRDAYQSIGNKTKEQEQLSAYFKELEAESEKQAKGIDKLQSKFKESQSRLSSLQSKDISKYQDTASYAQIQNNLEKIKSLNESISSQKALGDGVDIDKMNSDLKEMNSLLSKSETIYNNLTKPLGTFEAMTASNKTLSWIKNNTKATKELGNSFELLAEKQKRATTFGELEQYNKEYKQLVEYAQSKGLTGKGFFDEFGRGLKQIGQFAYTYGFIQQIPEVISKMTSEVIKVDDAITNLRMATSISNDEALSLMSTYSELGDELKATSVDVATSATEWLKQGKSIQESQNLAKDSIVLSKIGDLSSEEATKTITAAMKSYNMSESEVMGFVDKISAIDLVSATDVGGLSQAFNEVAANAKNAGVEAEKLLSYAAVIGETTQEGMASVGTSLNAIFSRMGNIKLSRLKDFETGEDLSNVETVLRGVGIQLRDSQDQFRDFDDVLDDTANRWNSFSTVQQRAVAQAFSGTHHMNEFMILMQNWNKVQEYTQTANEASGQSMEKFAAYQESVTGKIEGFKNAFQTLSTTTIDSDLFKEVIDSGTGILNILTQIVDVGGGIPAILGVIGGTAFIKNLDHLKVLKFPIFLSRSNIDKEMIKWFIVQVYAFGSFKINQRGVIAGTYTYEYSTKAESVMINVNVRKAEKTEYSAYGKLCANIACA